MKSHRFWNPLSYDAALIHIYIYIYIRTYIIYVIYEYLTIMLPIIRLFPLVSVFQLLHLHWHKKRLRLQARYNDELLDHANLEQPSSHCLHYHWIVHTWPNVGCLLAATHCWHNKMLDWFVCHFRLVGASDKVNSAQSPWSLFVTLTLPQRLKDARETAESWLTDSSWNLSDVNWCSPKTVKIELEITDF